MAKTTTKTAAAEKKPAKAKAPKAAVSIEKVSRDILDKLKSLGIEDQLQSDITWCLGSFAHDGNPSGLYENVLKALDVFKAASAKKVKGVTAKWIKDIEQVLPAK